MLRNDADPEGAPLSAVLVSSVAHGSLSLNAQGGFTYSPANNYSGPDQFSYRASDGSILSDPVLVSLSVNARPRATNDLYATTENTPLTVTAANGVLRNDADPEGAPLSARCRE